jgi:hypothetical protein
MGGSGGAAGGAGGTGGMPPIAQMACGTDIVSCKNGNICCYSLNAVTCDKCLSPEDCAVANTCGGVGGEYLSFQCDDNADCAANERCCVVNSGTEWAIECVPTAACLEPSCETQADCASGACLPTGLVVNPDTQLPYGGYEGYKFCQ